SGTCSCPEWTSRHTYRPAIPAKRRLHWDPVSWVQVVPPAVCRHARTSCFLSFDLVAWNEQADGMFVPSTQARAAQRLNQRVTLMCSPVCLQIFPEKPK